MSVLGGNVQVRYDNERDVVYVSIGNPRPGYGEPDDDMDSLIIRRDPKNHEVIGFTVIGFRKLNRSRLVQRLPFSVDFQQFGLG